MTENLLEFFKLLHRFHRKIISFDRKCNDSHWLRGYSVPIENTFSNLILEVDDEISEIIKIFPVSKEAAFVLGSLIFLYLKHEGVKTNFITFENIEKFIFPDREEFIFPIVREYIFELEEKNFIEINIAEFFLVRVFNRSDRWENDYYLIPTKPSFVPFANKKFELSKHTISKLNYL